MKRRLLIGTIGFGAFAVLVAGGSFSNAAEYEVEGTISQRIHSRDGTARVIDPIPFTVFVRDSGWMIRTTEYDAKNEIRCRREIGSIDGAQMFEVVRTLQPASTMEGGSVFSNAIPAGPTDTSVAGPLWLMFASGHHLRSLTSGARLTPVYDYWATPVLPWPKQLEAQWELMDGPGSLPSKVTYYSQEGATMATFSVLNRTNVGGVTLPTGFFLEQPNRQAEATVTGVRPICSRTNLLPQIEGRASISDHRLNHDRSSGGEFGYTTNRWLSMTEARNIYEQQKAERAADYERIATNIFRTVPVVDPWNESNVRSD